MIYSLGMSTSEHLKNKEQDSRLDEQKKKPDRPFDEVEKILSEKMTVQHTDGEQSGMSFPFAV